VIERVQQFTGRHLGVQRPQRLDDGRADDLTGRVAAHPIGHRKQPGPGISSVLVILTVQSDIRLHRVADGERSLIVVHGSVLSGQIANEERSQLPPGRGFRLDLLPVRGQLRRRRSQATSLACSSWAGS
jgi:hypothetical protein